MQNTENGNIYTENQQSRLEALLATFIQKTNILGAAVEF